MSFDIRTLSNETQHSMKNCGMLDHAAALQLGRLREVFIKHYDFEGIIKQGSVVILDVMAEDCLMLFQNLYQEKFPISSVRPICRFDADDNTSMNENNASAYNPRFIAGTKDLSSHAYGMALDINPVQNPYLKFGDMNAHDMKIFPASGKNYLNRAVPQPGMTENIVPLSYQYGFTIWGGSWTDRRIDYHHFQAPASLGIICTTLDFEYATEFYSLYKEQPDFFIDFPEDQLLDLKDYLLSHSTDDIAHKIRQLMTGQIMLKTLL